jgi:membrane associated rhomboid family serine protease
MAYSNHREFSLGPIGFLIVANIILFIATSINTEFIRLLGFHPAIFLERPWTIVTNLFIHAPFPNIGHILANMITLYFFGNYLIRLIGKRKFLIVYFLGGIIGNVFYAFILTPPYLSVGASGAIFALGGVLTIMRPRLRVLVFPIPAPLPLWAVVIGGFLIISFFPNVAWQSHLGGLAFGLTIGYFFRRREHIFF